MIPPSPETDALLQNLIALLDEEIDLLSARLDQMQRLSRAVVHRDDDAMEPVLDEMERIQQRQASTDARLAGARTALAAAAGCEVEQMRLSRLLELLQGQDRSEISRRRRRIVELSDALRREHLQAVLLLAESARINRLLLETLFPASEPVTTYDAGGADQWRPDTGLVDTEL